MNALRDKLTAAWNRLDPKVRKPFVTALGAALTNWIVTGAFDATELRITGVALLMGAVGYATENAGTLLKQAPATTAEDSGGLVIPDNANLRGRVSLAGTTGDPTNW